MNISQQNFHFKFKTKIKRKVKKKGKKAAVKWASSIFLNKFYGSLDRKLMSRKEKPVFWKIMLLLYSRSLQMSVLFMNLGFNL